MHTHTFKPKPHAHTKTQTYTRQEESSPEKVEEPVAISADVLLAVITLQLILNKVDLPNMNFNLKDSNVELHPHSFLTTRVTIQT
jgi:hypothetical protein